MLYINISYTRFSEELPWFISVVELPLLDIGLPYRFGEQRRLATILKDRLSIEGGHRTIEPFCNIPTVLQPMYPNHLGI